MFHGPEHRILDLHVKPTWQSTTTTSCTITRKEHIMSTTNNLESTLGLGSLKKVATRAVFAGGLGLAVIGLGAGLANADPATPTIPAPPGLCGNIACSPPVGGVLQSMLGAEGTDGSQDDLTSVMNQMRASVQAKQELRARQKSGAPAVAPEPAPPDPCAHAECNDPNPPGNALHPQPLLPGHSLPGHLDAPPDPCARALCNDPHS
jgi:hypothetical protein